MTISDKMEAMLERRMARLDRINDAGVRCTTALAAFNSKLIFRLANAKLPSDVRMPEGVLEEFAAIMLEGTVPHDSKADAG